MGKWDDTALADENLVTVSSLMSDVDVWSTFFKNCHIAYNFGSASISESKKH